MYTKLFYGITDALKKLDEAKEMLEKAQIEAEDIYIDDEN